MADHIMIQYDKDLECYAVGVSEFFDPFPNLDYFYTFEMALEHAQYLADHHKIEIRVLGEDGKLKEIIVNSLL